MAWLLPVAGPDVCEHWGEMLGRMPLIPSSPVDGDQRQTVGFERQLCWRSTILAIGDQ